MKILNFSKLGVVSTINSFILISCIFVIGGCDSKSDVYNNPAYIAQLDSLIDNNKQFEKTKLLRIENIKNQINNSHNAAELYSLNSILADEYYHFNSDSAFKYINRSLEIAQKNNNPLWITQTKLKKASSLTMTGMLLESKDLLDSIDKSELSDELLVDYYGQYIYLYSHLGNFHGGDYNDFYAREKIYKDSIMSMIPEEHPDYLWYKGLYVLGTDRNNDSIIEALKQRTAHSSVDAIDKAKLYYILAKLYEEKGDEDNYKKYMASSAMQDVKGANFSELSSLEELARIMYDDENGDIYHAYKYINYCLNKALAYPNRVKAHGISSSIHQISHSYQNRLDKEQKMTKRLVLWEFLLVAVLCISVIVIITLNVKVRRQKLHLKDMNKELMQNFESLKITEQKLQDANKNLHTINEELNESNYVKEKYICYLFSICSEYIDKIADLKRKIHIAVVNKNYSSIEKEIGDFDMRDELKEFYRSFDTIFLNIYPDFISDFNELLQDDKKIYPKPGELLNTELRTYALIRLGITDSIKIAEFLHCKPQSVYNTRFKVRSKSKVDKNDFEEALKTLGNFSHQER